MSKEVERMLKRMIAPNADIRYTAKEVLKDPYWSDDHRESQCFDFCFSVSIADYLLRSF